MNRPGHSHAHNHPPSRKWSQRVSQLAARSVPMSSRLWSTSPLMLKLLVLSRDGRLLFVGCGDGTARVWRMKDGQSVSQSSTRSGAIPRAARFGMSWKSSPSRASGWFSTDEAIVAAIPPNWGPMVAPPTARCRGTTEAQPSQPQSSHKQLPRLSLKSDLALPASGREPPPPGDLEADQA